MGASAGRRVAIIGTGKIGEALLGGLIAAGKPPRELVAAVRTEARADELTADYEGVRVTESAADAVNGADIVVIAVKPDAVAEVLSEIADVPDEGDDERLIVTLVGGVPAATYENALPAGAKIIRVMPNTPMLVGEGMSGVAAGRFATEADVAIVVDLMQAVGKVMVLPESKLHALTAISGSGPAYFFLMAEALADAGVDLGLTRQQAAELAAQTIKGAGVLLVETSATATDLRAAVTSPGGTTSAAIREFEKNGLRAAVFSATAACATRSEDIASHS